MGLNKAIQYLKEKRKPFRGSRRYDYSCRNHGSCSWCRGNRFHRDDKEGLRAQQEKDWPRMSELREDYLSTWLAVLGRLAKWRMEEITAWLEEEGRAESLRDPDHIVYQMPPEHWVAPALIPTALWETLPTLERLNLWSSIQKLLEDGKVRTKSRRIKWGEISAQIDALIEGARLSTYMSRSDAPHLSETQLKDLSRRFSERLHRELRKNGINTLDVKFLASVFDPEREGSPTVVDQVVLATLRDFLPLVFEEGYRDTAVVATVPPDPRNSTSSS